MSRYSESDPYLDASTGVLINLLGITEETILEQTEAALAATRSYELSQIPLTGRFDLAHLQAIHKCLFGDLYEWAGQLRTIDISKGGTVSPITCSLRVPLRRSSVSLQRKITWPG